MTCTLRIAQTTLAAGFALFLVGCGNVISAEVNGMTGVTVDGQGRPAVVVAVCSDHVDQVTVYGTREGLDDDEANPKLGSWTSERSQSGTFTIDVTDPGPDWTASGPIDLETDRDYIVGASRSDADVETMDVSFRGGDLAALEPGDVIVRDGEVWSRTTFDEQACD